MLMQYLKLQKFLFQSYTNRMWKKDYTYVLYIGALRSCLLNLLCGAGHLKQNLVLHVGSMKLNAQNEE